MYCEWNKARRKNLLFMLLSSSVCLSSDFKCRKHNQLINAKAISLYSENDIQQSRYLYFITCQLLKLINIVLKGVSTAAAGCLNLQTVASFSLIGISKTPNIIVWVCQTFSVATAFVTKLTFLCQSLKLPRSRRSISHLLLGLLSSPRRTWNGWTSVCCLRPAAACSLYMKKVSAMPWGSSGGRPGWADGKRAESWERMNFKKLPSCQKTALYSTILWISSATAGHSEYL